MPPTKTPQIRPAVNTAVDITPHPSMGNGHAYSQDFREFADYIRICLGRCAMVIYAGTHYRERVLDAVHRRVPLRAPPPLSLHPSLSPYISAINISCSRTGNTGLELLSEVVHRDTPSIKTLDMSFCDIDERGIQTMRRSLRKRKRKRKRRGMPGLEGLILSRN